MIVKVCGLNSQANALDVVLAGADMVGFIFHPATPRLILQPFGAEFNGSIPSFVKRVGVFVNASLEEVLIAKANYSLDIVQLHGEENTDYCARLMDNGIPVIKAFSVDERFDFRITSAFHQYCTMFLFDASGRKRGGNGISFSWDLLNSYVGETPFLLSGGISIHHLPPINELKHPAMVGVDINSRFEISPGVKDIAKVREFVEGIQKKKLKATGSDER